MRRADGMRWRRWSIAAALLAWAGAGMAAEALALSRFEHTAFGRREGAPSEVDGIVQGADGYLWLAGDRGLFYFDGVRFRQFVPVPGESLLATSTNRLFARPDGSLVITYGLERISILKDGHLTHLQAMPELDNATAKVLMPGKDGDIWFADAPGLSVLRGMHTRVAYRFDDGRGMDGFAVDEESGDVWIARIGRLWRLKGGKGPLIDVAPEPPDTFGLTWLRPGWLFVRTRGKQVWRYRIEDDRLSPLEPFAGYANDAIPDAHGGVWLPDLGGGVRHLPTPDAPSSAMEVVGTREGLTGDFAYRASVDREGDTWVSTQGGIDRFRATPFAALPVPRGAHSLTIVPGNGSDAWIGSENNPLLHWDGRTLTPTPVPVLAMSLFWDGSALWASTRGELWRVQGNDATRTAEIPGRFFPTGLARDASGTTWFSAMKDGGSLWTWNGAALERALAPMKATSITRAPDGSIWAGGDANTLVRIDHDARRTFGAADGLAVGTVRALAWRGDELWVGGLEGLQVLRHGRFRTVMREGAPLVDVTGIAFDAGGNAWVHGLNGLVRMAARLLAETPPAAMPGDVRMFDMPDGIEGLPSDVRSLPSLKLGGDGRLWVQNLSSIASIDPLAMPAEAEAPAARILFATSKGRDVRAGAAAHLDATMRDLEVTYTAPLLGVPERARFRYRLEGFDEGWQDAGGRRTAFYTNLPPGRYTFHVQAGNAAGQWNPAEATMALTVAPAWYQTLWFYAVAALALLAAVYLLHRRRMHQQARQWRIRLDERTAIARDLHDTILQGSQSTALQLQAIAGDVADDALRARLARIASLARETAGESRARLEDLRADQEDDRFPVAGLIELGGRLARQHRVAFEHAVHGKVAEMEGAAGREIRSAVAEMLINAFTHARAARVVLAIEYGRRFTATVSDDGVGIGNDVLATGQVAGHFGLRGLRERATRLGGHVEWKTEAGRGTAVTLAVPSHRFRPHKRRT